MNRVLRTSVGMAWLGSRSLSLQKKEDRSGPKDSAQKQKESRRPEIRIMERQSQEEPLTLIDFEDMEADLSRPRLKMILFGESHFDDIAQKAEILTYKKLTEKFFGRKRWALALEFLDRDKQNFVNQYLKSSEIPAQSLFISLEDAHRYSELVKVAKSSGNAIVAANAPKRFVSIVSRVGPDILNDIADTEEEQLPPLPYPSSPLSEAYDQRLRNVWPDNKTNVRRRKNLIASQCLWDATMAHSILRHQKRTGDAVFLVCGRFHIEFFLGIVDQIEHLLDTPFGTDLSLDRDEFRLIVAVPLPAEQFDRCEDDNWESMRHHPHLQTYSDFILFTRQPPSDQNKES